MSGRDSERHELMAGQLGIWYAQQLDPHDPIYNSGEYVEIHGNLDVDLFETALRFVTCEAEALHLRFSGNGETLRQYVDTRDDWPLPIIDVTSAADPLAAALDWMRAEMGRPVDLRNGPLFAQALFKVASDRFFWYLRAHHIAMDGFSASLVAARQAEVYTALLAGDGPREDGALKSLSVLLDADISYRASTAFRD